MPQTILTEAIGRHGKDGPTEALLPRLALQRSFKSKQAVAQYARPTLCLALQGQKLAYVGNQRLAYDADHFLISLVELPLTSSVVAASREKPYLGLALELDLATLALLAARMELRSPPSAGPRAVIRAPVDQPLLDALARYIALLDASDDIPFLATGIEGEIWYRLLKGSAGEALSQLAFEGSVLARIGRVTAVLREHYAETINLAELAARAGMSRTTFHEIFRRMTGSTPLQFQKLTRLQEARRLLSVAQRNVFQVAFDVGYVSPSQFNRDYRRMFGVTPAADARRMQTDNRASILVGLASS